MSEPLQETPTEQDEPETEPAAPEQTSDEPEPATSDEPEPEPETPPQSIGEAEIEAIGKKLDGLRKHVTKRMGEILGDDAPLYRECMCGELFNTPGWLPPIDPPPDAQAFMYHWLGQHAPSDYQKDQFSRECPDCNGMGEVLTGSKVQGQVTLPCITCSGMGWADAGRAQRIAASRVPNGPQPVTPLPASPEGAAFTAPAEDTPEIAALKAQGFIIIPPMVAAS